MAASRITLLKRSALALVMLMLAASSAPASEGGQGTYPPGFQDLLAGYLPPPGFYVRESAEFYTGSMSKTVREGEIQADLQISLPIQFTALSQVTRSKLWGSYYSWVLVIPLAEPSLEGRIVRPGGPIVGSGSISALAETYIMPLVLGWHNGRSHQKVWLAFYAPTGAYSTDSFVYTSLNHWAYEIDYGYTFLDPKTGYEFDIAPGYTFNSQNAATQYHDGQELHVDFAALKHLSTAWGIGAVGYAFVQTTPDTGAGAMLGGYQGRAFALGPILTYSTRLGSVPIGLTGKYYGEFGVQNRFAGHSYWLHLTASL